MSGLYDLTDRVIARIKALDPVVEVPRFISELEKARPDLMDRLRSEVGGEPAARIADALAARVLGLVKQIPVIVGAIREAVEKRSTHPAVRCAMVGALAYLVQPRDLIPDDRPGGFGFVDDSLILRATVSEYFDALPPGFTNIETERENIRLLALCVPSGRVEEFQAMVDGVWHLFHRLLLLPRDSVDGTILQFVEKPLEAHLFSKAPVPDGIPPGPDLQKARDCAARLHGSTPRLVFSDGVEVVLGKSP